MYKLLARIWKLLEGNLQWHLLWLLHDKFMLGVCGVVLNAKGEVLLLRHRFWKDGSWGLPSGYAQKGETVEKTLSRELLEETGVEVLGASLVKIVSGYKLRLEIVLTARAISDAIRIDGKEVVEAKFFPLAALPNGLLSSHRDFVALATKVGRVPE